MINPPKPPEGPKPTKALFKSLYQEPISREGMALDTPAHKESMFTHNLSSTSMDENLGMKLNSSSNSNKIGTSKSVNFVTNI